MLPKTAAQTSPKPTGTTPPKPALAEATTLLTLPKSAYHVSLHLDGEATYLLTDDALFRMLPGREPEGTKLDLGEGPVATSTSFVYWSKGAVFSVPKVGGAPQKLASFPQKPQYFVTSGDKFAWIDRTEGGKYSIVTLRDAKPVVVFSTEASIDAAAMINDWVFFVERVQEQAGTHAGAQAGTNLSPPSFRFGGVALRGGKPSYTSARPGRTPAMLVAAQRLYYYDVNTNQVRSISPDFQEEQEFGKNVICSPLTVADRIYCGHVEGLHSLSLKDQAWLNLQPSDRASITTVAANQTRIVWVSDAGRDKLAVKLLPAN